MTSMTRTRILVDNSIFNISKAADEVTIDPPGEVPFRNKMLLLRGVRGVDPPPPSHHKFIYRQIECLPTIAGLAKEGMVDLYSYFEIGLENIRIPYNFLPLRITSIFCNVTFSDISPVVNRSRLVETDMLEKESKIKFCEVLLGCDPHTCGEKEVFPGLSEDQIATCLDVLRQICAKINPKHFDDAIHLWTAELRQMHYFLTADKKFINATKGNSSLKLFHCQTVCPVELLNSLGVGERDHWPFEPGRLYTLNGRPAEWSVS